MTTTTAILWDGTDETGLPWTLWVRDAGGWNFWDRYESRPEASVGLLRYEWEVKQGN